MPGTTPGIFIYVVFGTTRSSRQKVAQVWQKATHCVQEIWSSSIRRKPASSEQLPAYVEGRITVQRSLTVTSAARGQASRMYDEENLSESSDIWMKDITDTKVKRSKSAMSMAASSMKPLPLPPMSANNKPAFKTTVSSGPTRAAPDVPVSAFNKMTGIEEKSNPRAGGFSPLSRATTSDSLRVPDDFEHLGTEHSDDSGPILPIQRPEVRFSKDVYDAVKRASGRDRRSKNFSRPHQ